MQIMNIFMIDKMKFYNMVYIKHNGNIVLLIIAIYDVMNKEKKNFKRA